MVQWPSRPCPDILFVKTRNVCGPLIEFPWCEVVHDGERVREVLNTLWTLEGLTWKIPTPHKPHLPSCTTSSFSLHFWSSQDFSIFVLPQLFRSLLCVSRTLLDSVGMVLSPCVLRRQYPQRKVVVSIHCAYRSLRGGFVVTEDMHLSRVMSPSEIQRLAEDVVMRSGQATPTARGGNLSKKYDEQLTTSTLSSVPSDQFYDTMEISNSTAIQVESASRGDTPCRRPVWTRM